MKRRITTRKRLNKLVRHAGLDSGMHWVGGCEEDVGQAGKRYKKERYCWPFTPTPNLHSGLHLTLLFYCFHSVFCTTDFLPYSYLHYWSVFCTSHYCFPFATPLHLLVFMQLPITLLNVVAPNTCCPSWTILIWFCGLSLLIACGIWSPIRLHS